MKSGMLLVGLQIGTSLGRLAGFSFAVLTFGKVAGDGTLLLVIGYLPYIAFFDTLIQSGSRARYLHAPGSAIGQDRWHGRYARTAILAVGVCLAMSMSWAPARYLLIVGTWPLGALGYVWERRIAQRGRQLLLAVTELVLLGGAVACYSAGQAPWQILLICIVSFPAARLTVLALPMRAPDEASTQPVVDPPRAEDNPAAIGGWRIGRYIGTSLAQQLVAASAASLPAIYAQTTGDLNQLSVNVAVFRSLHSLAAVVSLTINAMSSRIFYRQTGGSFESFEAGILAFSRIILGIAVAFAAIAALVFLSMPDQPAMFSFAILPVMAMINAESSMLYNRGLPAGTLHCQFLIFLLSLAFLFVLVKQEAYVLVTLAAFVAYVLTVVPTVLRSHRRVLGHGRAA